MSSYKSVFSIIGPVMVGPSSSHTAGAVRLGRLAAAVLGCSPKKAEIGLHGSFAQTGAGHGTDKAIVAGLLGFDTADDRIREAFSFAKAAGLEFVITQYQMNLRAHPCSARILLWDGQDECQEIVGSSLGGGSVSVTKINGYDVSLSGEYYTLLTNHEDRPGMVKEISAVVSEFGVNIAFLKLARKTRGKRAFMTLETDQPIPVECIGTLRSLPGIERVRVLPLLG